jgi:hypothetical protein
LCCPFIMAVLDSAYDLFSALETSKVLSLLAEMGDRPTELACFVEAACPMFPHIYNASNAAQLMPHLQQRRFLNKAAAATAQQLQLMSAHLQSAASLASLHGSALESAKALLNTNASLPEAWQGQTPHSSQDAVSTEVQRDLADAGGCMGQWRGRACTCA